MRSDDARWGALAAWGDHAVVGGFETGSMNEVRAIELDGRRAVARLSSRAHADLDWEIALLQLLDVRGLPVPRLVATSGGAMRVGALVVMEWVNGREAKNAEDYRLVGKYLRRLHALTADELPQRPGWRTCVELVGHERSGPVDLEHIPADVLERCRRAWSKLAEQPRSVIHGDPNPANVRIMEDGTVVLLDWDEARVDASCLDLARPPMRQEVSGLEPPLFELALHAFRAWEAALFWHRAPEHAAKQLARIP